MELFLTHLPHIVPAAVGLVFLLRFAITARRSPPADLTDEQLRRWQARRRSAERAAPPSSADGIEAKRT